ANVGAGGNRSILGSIVNRGILRAGDGLTWELGQNGHGIVLESGSVEGEVVFTNGSLAVKDTFSSQTVVVGGPLTLIEQAHPNVTIWIRGKSTTLIMEV